MGFLSNDDTAALGAFLAEEGEEEAVSEEPEVQAESSEPAEDVNEEAETGEEEAQEAQAPEAEDSPAEEDEPISGHRVPYDRFKQVLEARNGYRDEIDHLNAQMAELQGQLETRQQAPAAAPQATQKSEEDKWLDDIIGASDPPTDAYKQQFEAIEDRMYQQEVQMARHDLEYEVADAMHEFPGVPREVMLKAVANDPSVTAHEVAESYSSWVAEIEEAALADYIADNPTEEVPAPEVVEEEVRRPSRAGATSATAASEGAPSPRTVKEGSELLRAFMKRSNPFA